MGVTRPRRRSLLWWTLAPMTTCHRHELPASTSHGEHRAPPLSRVTRSTPVRRCRTVRLRSLVSPSGRSASDVPPVPALPPSGTRSLRLPDRPRAQRATGNGCPAALVDSCAVHAARDTYVFDMSILILVHLNQKAIRRGGLRDVRAHLPLVTIRHPQAVALSVKIVSKAGGNEGRGPSLHMDALRVHSPPPFPLRPRPAGPTPLPLISCPAVLWLLGQEGE